MESPSNTKYTRIRNYEEFLKKAKPLSHFCIQRKNLSYYHHFLVLGIFEICRDEEDHDDEVMDQGSDECAILTEQRSNVNSQSQNEIDAVTIVHYSASMKICTGSSSSFGKLIRETFIVSHKTGKSRHADQNTDLLQFDKNEVYLVDNPYYPKSEDEFRKAYKRLDDRLGEQMYHLTWNNCESAVNHILTGKSQSKQAQKRRAFVDCVQTVFVDLKNVGFKTAILVSLLGAVAGSLVRRAYVKIIVAAIVSYSAGMALNSNCLNSPGSNLILEAMKRINQSEQILSQRVEQHDLLVLSKIRTQLNNSNFICNLTEFLAEEAQHKTFHAMLLISLTLETVIFITFACYNLFPLSGSLSGIEFSRIIALHILSGYPSLVLSAWLGFHGFSRTVRPAMTFFFIALSSGVILRYILTVIVGSIFDIMTICRCCRSRNCKWKSKCIGRLCKRYECYCNTLFFIICFAVILVVSYFTVILYLL